MCPCIVDHRGSRHARFIEVLSPPVSPSRAALIAEGRNRLISGASTSTFSNDNAISSDDESTEDDLIYMDEAGLDAIICSPTSQVNYDQRIVLWTVCYSLFGLDAFKLLSR